MAKFAFSIDTPEPIRIGANEYFVRGWVLTAPAVPRTSKVAVIVDGRRCFVTDFVRRYDVAEHFNNRSLIQCGFYSRFSVAKREPVLVRIVVEGADLNEELTSLVWQPGEEDGNSGYRTSAYSRWLWARENENSWSDNRLAEFLAFCPTLPKITIVCGISYGDGCFVSECIRSVLRQKYSNFELFLDPEISDQEGWDCIANLVTQDPRSLLLVIDEAFGSVQMLNAVLRKATGDFVVILDGHDELHPSALIELVRIINSDPDVNIVYSDEDEIDDLGQRSCPLFKSGPDLDMLASANYLGGLIALRRESLEEMGGFRDSYAGEQMWDAILRLVDYHGESCLRHIQKILYHRRALGSLKYDAIRGNGAMNVRARLRLVSDHLARKKTNALPEVSPMASHIRIRYKHPTTCGAGVFVRLIDGRNQQLLVERNIIADTFAIYEVHDRCVTAASSIGGGGNMQDANLASTNQHDAYRTMVSLAECPQEVLIFINRPIELVSHQLFSELISQACRPDCGLVTGLSLNTDGVILHSGFIIDQRDGVVDPFAGKKLSSMPLSSEVNFVRQVETVSDHFFAVQKTYLMKVGGFAVIGAEQMQAVVNRLVRFASDRGLRVLVTPDAIATFASTRYPQPPDVVSDKSTKRVTTNANATDLFRFSR